MRLQSKFLYSIVPTVAIALLSLGAVVYFQLLEGSHSAMDREVSMTLERAEWRLNEYIDTVEVTATLLSDSAQVADWYGEEVGQKSTIDRQAEVISLFRKVRNSNPEFREIRLLSRIGVEQIRLADPALENVTVSEAGSTWFADVGLNLAAPIHSMVIPHSDDGKVSLTVTRPIRLNSTGTSSGLSSRTFLHGYLTISAEIEKIGIKMASYVSEREGHLLILNADNEVMFAPTALQSNANAIALALADKDRLHGEDSLIHHLEVDGEWLNVAVRENTHALRVVVVVSDSESDAVAVQIGMAVALITSLAIVCLSLLFMSLMKTIVLRPISRLQNNIVALGEGRSIDTAGVMRQDELGELAYEFQIMSTRLSRSMVDLQESHAHIHSLAYRDVLTELPNRRRFLDLYSVALDYIQGSTQQAALLFIDLDGFKDINDTEGHRVGDQLLRLVADRLTACVFERYPSQVNTLVPELNLVARIGGDEFVVFLRIENGADEARKMAEAILESMSMPVQLGTKMRGINSSIGIALYPEHATDGDSLIACADTAMYEAKRLRQQSCYLFEPKLRDEMRSRVQLSEDLHDALNGQLLLQYQPQFRLDNLSLHGVEALIRWEHPDRGLVPPSEFIPLAEDLGLINEIGQWVINEACRQWSEWHTAGLAPGRIAVNVSQRQFTLDDDISKTVLNALARHNMPPQALEVEITESCMMDAPKEVLDALHTIRDAGVHIALDDFGTGYSSLSLLAKLPINTLKIDRQFVSGVREGLVNDKILSAILNLGRTLDLTVVGEGVETASELERLRIHGCHIVQGYYMARPMWEADLLSLLHKHHGDHNIDTRHAC